MRAVEALKIALHQMDLVWPPEKRDEYREIARSIIFEDPKVALEWKKVEQEQNRRELDAERRWLEREAREDNRETSNGDAAGADA